MNEMKDGSDHSLSGWLRFLWQVTNTCVALCLFGALNYAASWYIAVELRLTQFHALSWIDTSWLHRAEEPELVKTTILIMSGGFVGIILLYIVSHQVLCWKDRQPTRRVPAQDAPEDSVSPTIDPASLLGGVPAPGATSDDARPMRASRP